MNDNLSPQQFVQQHVDFDRWAHGEIRRISDEHEFKPGQSRFTPEAGRKIEGLREARRWLTDNYSDVAHQSFHQNRSREERLQDVAVPLHEALPFHRPLVDEFLRKSGQA